MFLASELCTLGCYIYVRFVICLLGGKSKEKCYSVIQKIDYSPFNSKAVYAYNRILFNDISTYKLSDISSSFYIVDTLESILWCFMKSENYLEAVVAAINLGDDTDTIGALTGALAGIKYGYASIPKGWLDKLLKLDYITDLSNKFELVLKEKNLYKQLNLNL
jgi:ADP-ribosylglycohydrolase